MKYRYIIVFRNEEGQIETYLTKAGYKNLQRVFSLFREKFVKPIYGFKIKPKDATIR